jgi:hypothetical protein
MQHEINSLDYYYEKQEELTKECLLALKSIFMSIDDEIIHFRKYQIPFFKYNEFNLGFLWVNKKKIFLGFTVDKKVLFQTKQSGQKDLISTMEIDPLKDIPILLIENKINNLLRRYKQKQTMEIEQFIQSWLNASNAYDIESYIKHYHHNAILDDPSVGKVFKGHSGIRNYFESYFIGYQTQTELSSLKILNKNQLFLDVRFSGEFPEGTINGVFDITLKNNKIEFIKANLIH